MQLNTKQLYIAQPVPIQQPSLQVAFAKPVSYEFRVAEHLDAEGKITKVGLQVQVWEHDEYGAGNIVQFWSDVPRVKIKDGVIV